MTMLNRRDLLALILPFGAAHAAVRPWRIWTITYRGRTDVERGFADYFAQRGVPVEITGRDIALDPGRLPALVEEIRGRT
jgi:putative ABC transport system substrate-binding protein